MARKLKTYQTSVGFFDLAIAAPSMKAALEAWGADSNLFHQGVAKQSDDPEIIAATLAAPGVVLRRPVGSNGPFKEDAELPTDIEGGHGAKKARRKPRKPAPSKRPRRTRDPAAERRAALAYEREERRREREREREDAAREKERERRQRAVDKAQSALDAAAQRHQRAASELEGQMQALEKRARAEDARWEKEKARLETALRRARE